MLDAESEQIREVYALFGLAVYSAQCLERELAMVIAVAESSERFTVWDYDDRLAGNFESTFGTLVTIFSEVADAKDRPLLAELEKAVDDRNEIIHRYFWNRAVQFTSTHGRAEMLTELRGLIDRFESLDNQLSERMDRFANEKGVAQEVIEARFQRLLVGAETPHDSKQVRNPVTITEATEWKIGQSVECGIVLMSDVGNLVLGRSGLVLGPQTIPREQLRPKLEFAKALPATVSPKPRKAGAWNYVIHLANGYMLRVRPDEKDGKKIIRFGLRRKP